MDLLPATGLVVLFTFIPGLELRFSIPAGILTTSVDVPLVGTIQGLGLPWWYVFLVAVAANVLLGVIGYFALDWIVHRLLIPRWAWFARFYHRQVERVQGKIHGSIERWGWLGLALFIGVPFPGTGVYSGAVAAYALGMGFRKYIIAMVLGVLIAAAIVTAITLGIHWAL